MFDSIAEPIRVIFALVGLVLPLFMVPWTFKTAGKALSFGQNYIDKAAGYGKKYGSDKLGNKMNADWQRRKADRQALKKHDATIRAKDISRETPTTLGGRLSKNVRQRRAMMKADQGGFLGGRGNRLAQAKFEDAVSAAYPLEGKMRATARIGNTNTGETTQQRIDAETALATEAALDGRANRAAKMQAVRQAPGTNLNEQIESYARASYDAKVESGRKSAAGILGTGQAVQRAAAAGQLTSTGAIVDDARQTQINSINDETGKIHGRLEGQQNLEDVELRRMGINPVTATAAQRATAQNRLQNYRQTDARVQARDAVLDQGGKTMQSQTDFDTHGYTNAGAVVGSAILQQRGNLSATRQARLQRVAIQGTAEGHMTDQDIERAASREAQESIGAQVMGQKRGNQVDFESNLKAAITGDATQAANLDNRLIAAGKKSRDAAVASSSQRTAAVRSAQGYNGQLPTQRSISEQLDDAAYKATTEQAAADMAIGDRLQELDEAEDRVLLENAGVNPKTATAAQRAAIIGGASRAQRAAARAQISSQVATQSAGEAGYNLRTQIAKARGEIKGFDEAIDEVQLEETTNRFREADIQRLMSSKGLTRAEAEAESFKTITADRMKDLAARGISSGTGVSRDEATRLYHDASAENTYLAAAQAQAGSVGQAIGKDQIADTTMGVAAADILQRQAEQATGLKDDVAMEAFLNAQIVASGRTPSSITRENLRDTLISSLANQAQSAVIGSAALAGMDAGQRTEANAQGTLLAQQEAYNSPTKASASQQLDMARRDATDTLAAKEGVQAARQNQPQKDYGKTVADARKAQNAKVMQDAIRDAGQETIKDENSGIMVRIADAKPGGKMTEEVEKQAEQAYIDGNHARFAALVSILSKTSSGSDAARKLLDRTFKRNGSSADRKKEADRLEKQAKDKGNQDFTYEDFYQTVTAPFNADKRPDIAKGEKAAFEDAKANEVAVMDYRTKGRLFEYSLRPVSVPPTDPEYGKQTGARKVQISQTAANLKQIMTDRNLTSKQTTADFAQMYSFLFDGTTDSKGNVTGLGTPRREAMDAFKAQFGGETPQYKEVMAKITRDFKSQNNLP